MRSSIEWLPLDNQGNATSAFWTLQDLEPRMKRCESLMVPLGDSGNNKIMILGGTSVLDRLSSGMLLNTRSSNLQRSYQFH